MLSQLVYLTVTGDVTPVYANVQQTHVEHGSSVNVGVFVGVNVGVFVGVFGGVEVFTPYADHMSLMWEHDSQYMNVGVNGYFWKRLHVTVGLMRMRQAMWVLAYRYQM